MSSWLLIISKGGNSTTSWDICASPWSPLHFRKKPGSLLMSILSLCLFPLYCHWAPLNGACLHLLASSLQVFVCIGEISAPEPFLLQAKQLELCQPFLIAEILKFRGLLLGGVNFEYKLTTCLSCFHCFYFTPFWSVINLLVLHERFWRVSARYLAVYLISVTQ